MHLLAIALTLLLTHAAAQPAAPLQYGGKTYKTVKIGTQTWMAENMNHEAEGSVCYDNDPDNCAKYGRLYNWPTAMKVCPKGWHLPSNAEWDKLYRFAGGTKGTLSLYDSPTAGKHLKAVSGWNPYEGIENLNTHGFSALPGGYGSSDGSFDHVGSDGNWWSASEGKDNSDYAYLRYMYYSYGSANWNSSNKSYLYSVRCVKD